MGIWNSQPFLFTKASSQNKASQFKKNILFKSNSKYREEGGLVGNSHQLKDEERESREMMEWKWIDDRIIL